jgi:hypothetical protein
MYLYLKYIKGVVSLTDFFNGPELYKHTSLLNSS